MEVMYEDVVKIVKQTINLPDSTIITEETRLLGNFQELDSMSVVLLLAEIEEKFNITIHDDEVSADIFETTGSLTRFIETKLK